MHFTIRHPKRLSSLIAGQRRRCVWLAVLVLICFNQLLFAEALEFGVKNGSHSPKLIASIEDQTLSISAKSLESLGPLDASEYYSRDLHESFTNVSRADFSAYVYNDEVVDAFVIDHQLMVVAKSIGLSKVAITAENDHGAMIDWFVVTVEANKRTRNNSDAPVFTESLHYIPVNRTAGIEVHFPMIKNAKTTYSIHPALPSGLRFHSRTAVLNGSLEAALSEDAESHYYVAIVESGQVGVQRFALYESVRTDKAFLFAERPLQPRPSVFDTYTTSLGTQSHHYARKYQPTRSSTLGSRTVLASRAPIPSQVLLSEQTSIRQQFLHGLTSALHSRFRRESDGSSLHDQNSMTVWQYASSRTRSNLNSPRHRAGAHRTGIYVGFDAQLEDNWTTGLSIGFDHDRASAADLNVASPNRSKSFTPAMTTVSPYARWQDGQGSEIWGMLGFGRDNISVKGYPRTQRLTVIDNTLMIGAIGWRQLLGSRDSLEVATVGDAGFVMPLNSVVSGNEQNSLSEAITQTVRAGIEMSYAGEQVQPYFGISGMVDGNATESGTSLEAMGGIRYTSLKGVTVEAEGRTHAPQWLNEQRAWVVSVAAHVDPGHQGQGLALSIAPSYGINTTGFGRHSLNQYALYDRRSQASLYNNMWTMSGTLSYGMPFGGTGVITPFGELAVSTVNETRMGVRFELGSRLDKLLDFEIAGTQSRTYRNALDKGVDLQLRFVF